MSTWQLMTPHGLLKARWPDPLIVYDGLEAHISPVQPEPFEVFITLDGHEITRKRADEIIRGMKLRMLHDETSPHPLATDQSRGLIQWTPQTEMP